MAEAQVRKRLAEGIVRLVEEIIDYKTEVSIGGFVKITADKSIVFPVTLREHRRKEFSPVKQIECSAVDEKYGIECTLSKLHGRKRKIVDDETDKEIETARRKTRHSETKSPPKKIKPNMEDTVEGSNQADDTDVNHVDVVYHKVQNAKSERELAKKSVMKKRFPCVICSSTKKETVFNSEQKLFSHGKVHHRKTTSFKCQICKQTFSSFFKLHNHHYQIHSKIKNYSCKICKKSLTWSIEVGKHSNQHKSVAYTCRKCAWPGKLFHSYIKYVHHIRSRHRDTKCKKCDNIFKHSEELRNHFQEEHLTMKKGNRKMADIVKGKTVKEVKTKEVPKPQIGLSEAEKSLVFVRTVKSKSGKGTKVLHEPLKCPHCDMVYWHSASLKNHIHGQHSENAYTCVICGISMKHESSLKRHMKTHATAEIFACDQCDKKYKRNCELLRHIKLKHSGAEKSFVCSWCGNKFMTPSDLKTHENRHLKTGKSVLHRGKYPSRKGEIFCCGECNKIFQKESLLRAHISVAHRNERNFGCGVCGKFYGRSCHLRRHQLVAHGIKAKDTVLIKEDRDVEEKPHISSVKQEPLTSFTLEEGTQFVPEETEFVIVSDPSSQTVVLQSSADSANLPTQEEGTDVVVLHQCPMCEVTYSTEEEIRLHLTDEHNAIVLFETDEQVKTEEWILTN